MRVWAPLLWAPLLALAGACSSYAGSARDFEPTALAREPGWIAVGGVPLARQESEAGCGAAAIAMVVAYWTGADPEGLVAKLGEVPDRGLSAGHLRAFARAHHLAAFLVEADLADLQHELARGRPVLVGLAKRQRRGVLTHYEVVVAVHPRARRVVTLDPGRGWRENSFAGFLAEWRPARGLALVVSARQSGRATAAGGGSTPSWRARVGATWSIQTGASTTAGSTPGSTTMSGTR